MGETGLAGAPGVPGPTGPKVTSALHDQLPMFSAHINTSTACILVQLYTKLQSLIDTGVKG